MARDVKILCPIHNRRYQERVVSGWCVTCEYCEAGFHDGETVRAWARKTSCSCTCIVGAPGVMSARPPALLAVRC